MRRWNGECEEDSICEHKSSSLPCQASCLVCCSPDALLRSSHNLSHRAGSLPGPLRWRRDATSSYLIRRSQLPASRRSISSMLCLVGESSCTVQLESAFHAAASRLRSAGVQEHCEEHDGPQRALTGSLASVKPADTRHQAYRQPYCFPSTFRMSIPSVIAWS